MSPVLASFGTFEGSEQQDGRVKRPFVVKCRKFYPSVYGTSRISGSDGTWKVFQFSHHGCSARTPRPVLWWRGARVDLDAGPQRILAPACSKSVILPCLGFYNHQASCASTVPALTHTTIIQSCILCPSRLLGTHRPPTRGGWWMRCQS